MANLKHVGRIAANKRKVIVANRVIPGDSDHCLVVTTENLSAEEHDSLIKAVESASGQSAYEFSEAMARERLPDGRIMLAAFHTTGKLAKLPTEHVEMTPNNQSAINLAELNKMIAEQKGVTVADLALAGPNGQPVPEKKDEAVDSVELYSAEGTVNTVDTGVITDEDLAAQYRSQADSLFKEAKRLRDQAEELVPTKRKSKASA